jgi:CheY-like chemotaxis protein
MSEPTGRSDQIGVFLVDDQMLVRTGFGMLINAQDDLTVVGEAGDGAAAVSALAPGKPGRDATEVVLMDVRMPVMDGVEATRAIRKLPGRAGAAPILAMTANAMAHQQAAYVEAGMNGAVAKPLSPAALIRAVANALPVRTLETS